MAAQQFILLPREGLRAVSSVALQTLQSLPFASSTETPVLAHLPTGEAVRILDTLAHGGPQLIEMDANAAHAINGTPGPLRALPLTIYSAPEPVESADIFGQPQPTGKAPASNLTPFTVECVEARTGHPLAGVRVLVCGGGVDASGTTDQLGKLALNIVGSRLEQLRALTSPTHWGAYRCDVPVAAGDLIHIEIEPVVLPYTDAIKHYYRASAFHVTTGITVGVIDSGVGPHRDLTVIGGTNTVTGEPASQYEDWKGHGTHVARLIGASPSSPANVRGLAPGVRLRSYRVFGQNSTGATNYAILKAMIFAAAQGCDIINLSLGGGPPDKVVEEAIRDARENGMLVIIAAGNNRRQPVEFPAAYPGATAVSALGCVGCFPPRSICEFENVKPPSAANQNEFIARFSSFGPQIAATAPGVGVISTLPGDRYGPYSGTVVAGAAACLLSRNPQIYVMPRDRVRSDELERLLRGACTKRGFGSDFEGHGLPDPAVV